MQSIIRFFLTKVRLNYLAFVFLTILGIVTYNTMPKDVFPNIQLDKISVNGNYAGASIDNLNKIAVTKLEKDMSSINGVDKTESFVKSGEFTIILTLQNGLNKYEVLNDVKDVIANNKADLPSDMDEPQAKIISRDEALMSVAISSKVKSHDELVSFADELKTRLSTIEGISKIELNESTNRVYEIILDKQKIEFYGLNKELLISKIKKTSYIYPIGKIEDQKEHLFLSSKNGAKSIDELLNIMIKIDGKSIYISDIAKVEKKYKKSDILSFLNGGRNVNLGLFKSEKANAIALSKIIKEQIKKENELYKDIEIEVFNDTSMEISKRLNTVIASIMFGLILVSVSIYLLINKRVALIVIIGIPIAILIGVIVLSFTPYTINNITLIGALLILGVLVDDAVIIAENIQRHIVNGEDKLTSAIEGTKEVLAPVLASSLTTVFAFLPMFMLTGTLGEFLKMIPIAVVILIIASLIESFIFLPLHAYHVLNKDDKELDWSKFNDLYRRCLEFILRHKKKFVFSFGVLIPLLSVLLISNMRFQMFQDFDEERFFISGKFSASHRIDEVHKKTKEIESKLLSLKDELGFRTISYTVGQRTDNQERQELKSSVFEFNIELEDRVPQNFVEQYITPILSFDLENGAKRRKDLNEIIVIINDIFKSYKPKGLQEFAIKTEGVGILANDIEIFLATPDNKLMMESINELKEELRRIDGIIYVDDTAKKGTKELKIALNSYGQSLGFTESDLSSILASSYLESSQAKGLDEKGIIEFVTYDEGKDSFEEFKNYEIQIPNTSQQIVLSEIVDFTYITNFDSLYKLNGVTRKAVVANVNAKKITAVEALSLMEDKIKEIEDKGVKVLLEGEASKNEQMLDELSFAFFIAIFLIFITLLTMFDSFKYAFLVLLVIPFSVLGAVLGHLAMGLYMSLPSIIGILGLAGVVINNAIVMLEFIKKTKSVDELIQRATLRLRPIIITSITTFLGLSTLIFFATGSSKILQPIAVSLGFGLLWGTVLTLLFLPTLFAMINKNIKKG